jgi:methylenetetrahydrofolate reductase (NADPH)
MAADEGELLADCSLEVAGRRPATVRTLAAAAKCDVSVSAPVARDYGFSLDDRAGTSAAPDRFIRALAAGYDRQLHGEVKLHFSTFGGVAATADWISQFCSGRARAADHPTRTGSDHP